jgi:diacylglycerol kinase (ATP)
MSETTGPGPRRCAVIVNPSKIKNDFKDTVLTALSANSFDDPLWLETTEEDPGREMVARAVKEQVDLVLGAGGDGTIRVIAAGLVGSDIEFGIIPSGTGNLLARNLAIPLDQDSALELALSDKVRRIDMIKLTVDDREPDHFAVMAGVGVDAVVMQATNPKLKKVIGSAAYLVAAGEAVGRLPLDAVITIDDRKPFRRRASLCVVGNVGKLQADITLMPDAKADDGRLDLLIASPRRFRDWLRLISKVLLRRPHQDDQLDRLSGQKVRIAIRGKDVYQMDGDTEGECSTMLAEVVPGAILVKAPDDPEVKEHIPS